MYESCTILHLALHSLLVYLLASEVHLAFYAKKTNEKFLSGALGFSAGVMIYVSFVEIFVKARTSLEAVMGPTKGYWATTFGFLCWYCSNWYY